MLLSTLGAGLLGNQLTMKSTIKAVEGKSWSEFLVLSQPLTNFEIQKLNLNLMVFIQEIIYMK